MQTFSDAVRHHRHSMEREWESEKEKILNSLLGSSQDLEFPSETEVHKIHVTALLYLCVCTRLSRY